MGIQRGTYVAYGMKIERLPDEIWWRICDEQQEKVTSDVRLVMEGEYDNDDHFLVTTHEEVTPGQPFLVPPYAGTDEPYLSWDAALVEAAERIGAKPVLQPGWLFIPDES